MEGQISPGSAGSPESRSVCEKKTSSNSLSKHGQCHKQLRLARESRQQVNNSATNHQHGYESQDSGPISLPKLATHLPMTQASETANSFKYTRDILLRVFSSALLLLFQLFVFSNTNISNFNRTSRYCYVSKVKKIQHHLG